MTKKKDFFYFYLEQDLCFIYLHNAPAYCIVEYFQGLWSYNVYA